MTQTHEFNENLDLGSDWDKSLKSMNEYAKKWAEEEIMKIQCKVIHDIIEREKKKVVIDIMANMNAEVVCGDVEPIVVSGDLGG